MRIFQRKDLWLVTACLCVSTLWIDFSKIHRYHNSDSLVMVLTSLYQWTPLFWEQDRLGMLFPLLATPWRHPLSNLLAQGAMTTFVGLSSFFLLGYYVAGRSRGMAIGALGGIFLMVFTRIDQRFAHLIYVHQFATAAALGLWGLIWLEHWARGRSAVMVPLGALCIFMAHWINPGVAFAFGPLLAARGFCFRGLGRYFDQLDAATASGAPEPALPWPLPQSPSAHWWRQWLARLQPSKDEVAGLVAIGLSLGGSIMMSRTVAEPQPYHFLGPDEWLACAAGVWKNLNELFQHRWYRAIDAAGLVGLATLWWPAGRRMARLSLPLTAALLATAAVQYAFMTSLDHVHSSHFARYVASAVFFWQAALLGFAVIQVGALLPVTRFSTRIPAVLTIAMTVLAVICHGWASPNVVRAEIDHSLGQYTDDILESECTHVSGDYWHVWPAMFHANLRLADQHSLRKVWGIAQRSLPTEKLWRSIPISEMRIAEIIGDEPQSAHGRAHYRLPRAVAENDRGTIRVLRPEGFGKSVVSVAGREIERR